MTTHQKAQSLLNQFSDESIEILIPVMVRMLAYEKETAVVPMTMEKKPVSPTSKMDAFLRMQELRKETAQYDLSENQRSLALQEKYGT